jgi:hypothetical protein
MSKKARYGVLLDDNCTLDEVYDKLHRYQLGNNNVYYGRYRGHKITSTDIVDRDDLYLKIYGTNRNESLKQQVLKQLEDQQSSLFTKQKNIYQFSDKLNRLLWQRKNFLLFRPDWMIEIAESPYDGEEFIIAIDYVLLRDSQDDETLSYKQRKQFLKILDELTSQEKRGLVYSILESFGYVVNYLSD